MHLRLQVSGKILLASSLIVAVLAQAVHGGQTAGYNAANYFSYFTVISAFIAAGVLLMGTYTLLFHRPNRIVDYLRGAAVLYMTMTAIGYLAALVGNIALSPWNAALLPWANGLIHFIGPALVIGDWLVDPPKVPLQLHVTIYWLVYPVIYAFYSVGRGLMTGWYPYPLLDVRHFGYVPIALAGFALAGLIVAMSAGIVRTTHIHFSWQR
jgi:hypothetical protein